MKVHLLIPLLLISVAGCRTAPPTVIEQRAQEVQQFKIAITFKGMEGLKRVPYKYAALRIEMVRELSREPLTVLFILPCTAQELDGHLLKLEQDAEVISATPYE
ncbi:MAG: hypothetical protein K9J06_00090 [Flavobacteriales bacterium]|nr:hypothetical protein [Flavobacteriales bacterium]